MGVTSESGAMIDLRAESRARMPILPSVAQAPDLRAAALATWRGRMVNEYASSTVFDQLSEQLARAELPAREVATCRAFADEERRHGVLCGAVVESLGGQALASWPSQRPLPVHADVAPIEGVIRNLLSVSCLSETVAVALIGAERIEMPDGELRELLTGIYADEVGHARFGWEIVTRIVPTLDEGARARLGSYLAVALGHLEEHELGHLPVASTPPAEGAELGLCSGADARELFYATIEEVIVPRLEALGLPARRAWDARSSAHN